MAALAWLIPAALILGLLGLGAFLGALRTGQFEDVDGAAYRILDDDEPPQDGSGGQCFSLGELLQGLPFAFR